MRTNRFLVLGLSAVLLLWISPGALGDEVVLKSGTTRRGKVLSVDDSYVVLETELGRIRIARSEVASMTRDEAEPGADAADDANDPVAADPRPPEPPAPAADDDGEVRRVTVDEEDEPLDAASRLERRRQSRILRTTGVEPRDSATEPVEDASGATIGGLDLARVQPGKNVIVFQPPKRFAGADGAIELGRRSFARMELAGVTAAWLGLPLDSGEERIAVRLADVKRHLEMGPDESRVRLLDGIGRGDWLRLRLSNGEFVQGRLSAIEEHTADVVGLGPDGEETQRTIRLEHLVQVEGLLHNSAAHMSLVEIEEGEPVAITTWPEGEVVIGRFAKRTASTLSLDTDGDGEGDVTIPRRGPLADVRRVPAKTRELAISLARGTPVRASYQEQFEGVTVTNEMVTRVAAVTAYALALEDEQGAVVVPFEDVTRLEPIDLDDEGELEEMNRRVPAQSLSCDLPLLPGAPAAEGRDLDSKNGVSAISDGRRITHVFVTAPFDGQVFGVRIGDPATQAARRAELRFETTVKQRATEDAGGRSELLSSRVIGMRVALLVDPMGFVDAIELSQAK